MSDRDHAHDRVLTQGNHSTPSRGSSGFHDGPAVDAEKARFEAMLNDPKKLAAAQDKLTREMFGDPQAGLVDDTDGPPWGSIAMAGGASGFVYVVLFGIGNAMQNEMLSVVFSAMIPFAMTVCWISGGAVVGKSSAKPIPHGALAGLAGGLAAVIMHSLLVDPSSVEGIPAAALVVAFATGLGALGGLAAQTNRKSN